MDAEFASKFRSMVYDESMQLEKKAASKARVALKSTFLSEIKRTFHRGKSGELEKSTVTTKFADGLLDRLSLVSPHYSFKNHFGSTLHGTQGETSRRGASVRSFVRHLKGKDVQVSAYSRGGGTVAAMQKNRKYLVYNHIARALKKTTALDTLATELGNSRAVIITSQIDF
ncbi:MAG: hypothetical protein EOO07_18845 [Chitinophagaceae bacterium]|nr:MAG: hypothetical protein EOO07_18845 [Chitinophagaceae bacterium]